MTSAALPRTDRARRTGEKPPPRARRVVLVSGDDVSGRGDELVRRYRMARLRLEPRMTRGEERFAHLRNFHD